MKLNRKDFIKMLGAAGLGAAFPGAISITKSDEPYEGPFYIMIHAGGGWDPTTLMDPKGATSLSDPSPMNHYLDSQYTEVGNFAWAPNLIDENNAPNSVDDTEWDPAGFNQTFLQRYQNDLLVINGVDTGTNSHDTGTRAVWSGSIIEGFPAFAGTVAAAYGQSLPMAFFSTGGYDDTDGLVSPSRMPSTNDVEDFGNPHVQNPDNDDPNYYNDSYSNGRILARLNQKKSAMQKGQGLVNVRESMGQLYLARSGGNELNQLVDELNFVDAINLNDGGVDHWADATAQDELDPNGSSGNNNFFEAGKSALAAYRAGLAISASIRAPGGWDSHGNNDQTQARNFRETLHVIDALQILANRMGIGDKVVFVVGSDFGRTPGYNSGNGKDHWSITSMMFMGDRIEGGRVIGTTTDGHVPVNVNPNDPEQNDDNGERITPAVIHRQLRRHAGILNNELLRDYPIVAEDIDVFGLG